MPLDRYSDWLSDWEESSGMDETSTRFPGTSVALGPDGYTTFPNVRDSDGDGLHDGEEAASGTNPMDSLDYLRIKRLQKAGNSEIVTWSSVAGKTYDLEAFTSWLPGGPLIIADDVVATGTDTSRTNSPMASVYFYRVRLEP